MAKRPDRQKTAEEPQHSKSGFKIYFDAETEQWLRKKAKDLEFRSPQDMIHEKVRQARIKDKRKPCK